MMEREYLYELGGLPRPHNTKLQKILFLLFNNSLLNKFGGVKRLLLKAYDLPGDTSITKGFWCSAPLLKVGRNCGLGDTYIVAYAPIIIGDGCSFSFRNMIITSTHDVGNFGTVIGKPVIIGRNVWITSNCTILPGVTIGDNTIIASGSVVTKDIPSGVLAGGNPCKVIKNIDFRK
jgi:maltose O-acetyltransferase